MHGKNVEFGHVSFLENLCNFEWNISLGWIFWVILFQKFLNFFPALEEGTARVIPCKQYSSYIVILLFLHFRYVYKRLKFLGNKIISQSVSLVFLSVWHGYYEGYHICFFFEFLTVQFEQQVGVPHTACIKKKMIHSENDLLIRILYRTLVKTTYPERGIISEYSKCYPISLGSKDTVI